MSPLTTFSTCDTIITTRGAELVTQGIESNWESVDYGALGVSTFIGSLSGAVAASPLGNVAQGICGAAIGVGGYALETAVNGGTFDPQKALFRGIVSGGLGVLETGATYVGDKIGSQIERIMLARNGVDFFTKLLLPAINSTFSDCFFERLGF